MPQGRVTAAGAEQVLVGAQFRDPARGEDRDPVGVAGGVQAVHDGCPDLGWLQGAMPGIDEFARALRIVPKKS